MRVIVRLPLCPLYSRPDVRSPLVDEALYGAGGELIGSPAPGWARIRTDYRYTGYVRMSALLWQENAVRRWEALPKKMVLYRDYADVLSEPKYQSQVLLSLPRGAALACVGQAEGGWQQVSLCGGGTGCTPAGILAFSPAEPPSLPTQILRQKIVETAGLYRGTPYRWGGKSPAGIDCSGLVSLSYLLCGIVIHRDARPEPGFPLKTLPIGAEKPGDVLYFPDHVALYLGRRRYLHATGRAGDDGVTENSLDPADPDYREDLGAHLLGAATCF